MSSVTPLREEIKRLIVERLRLDGVEPSSIEDDQPLFGGGLGLDSVDALELVVGIEQRYGLILQGDDLDRAVFSSVASLAEFVERHVAARGSSEAPGA